MAPHSSEKGGYQHPNAFDDGEGKELQSFSLEDVCKHNRPEDCWLIIWGKIYDVTSWVPHHPGGSLIYVNAGKDSTQLFDAYHPLYVRKMLARYCIGEVKESANNGYTSQTVIEYAYAGEEDFYLTLKRRVEAHFKKLKINPRVHPHMFIKSFMILAGYLLFYYLTFFGLQSFWFSLLFAIATGVMVAEVGVSIQHDANHGAYSTWLNVGFLMSISLDFVGASSFMWRQQHVIGHHSFTNVENYDPDIRVKDPDVRRVTPMQPKHSYHRYQHIYLGGLYGLLALKSVFIDDFTAYITGAIGCVKISRMTPLEKSIFWGGKIFYAFYMFALPTIFSHHSTSAILWLYCVMQLVAGWVLGLFFQVAHVVEEADFPIVNLDDGVPRLVQGWATLQVSTTTNFSTDSILWTHLSGGLNFQIEHHLFPSVCHLHYPSMQPIVKSTCEEFNVPYKCFPNFWTALGAHFAYLKKIGTSDFKLHLTG